ncbi:hypothetical protein PR048_014432 [Dryococelus australis]|uniref:Uncharacterized protein n=1 Tax=Dryococelus australis TaxID=614101 RepID=A0ABQ9HEC7_9NEOP|nr:hypothetical protein PR048_014432 [Dryococelus australis]
MYGVYRHKDEWFLGADEIEFLPGGIVRVGDYKISQKNRHFADLFSGLMPKCSEGLKKVDEDDKKTDYVLWNLCRVTNSQHNGTNKDQRYSSSFIIHVTKNLHRERKLSRQEGTPAFSWHPSDLPHRCCRGCLPVWAIFSTLDMSLSLAGGRLLGGRQALGAPETCANPVETTFPRHAELRRCKSNRNSRTFSKEKMSTIVIEQNYEIRLNELELEENISEGNEDNEEEGKEAKLVSKCKSIEWSTKEPTLHKLPSHPAAPNAYRLFYIALRKTETRLFLMNLAKEMSKPQVECRFEFTTRPNVLVTTHFVKGTQVIRHDDPVLKGVDIRLALFAEEQWRNVKRCATHLCDKSVMVNAVRDKVSTFEINLTLRRAKCPQRGGRPPSVLSSALGRELARRPRRGSDVLGAATGSPGQPACFLRVLPQEALARAGMQGRGKREIPEKTRRPACIVRHYSHMRESGSNPAGNRSPVGFAEVGGEQSNHYTIAAAYMYREVPSYTVSEIWTLQHIISLNENRSYHTPKTGEVESSSVAFMQHEGWRTTKMAEIREQWSHRTSLPPHHLSISSFSPEMSVSIQGHGTTALSVSSVICPPPLLTNAELVFVVSKAPGHAPWYRFNTARICLAVTTPLRLHHTRTAPSDSVLCKTHPPQGQKVFFRMTASVHGGCCTLADDSRPCTSSYNTQEHVFRIFRELWLLQAVPALHPQSAASAMNGGLLQDQSDIFPRAAAADFEMTWAISPAPSSLQNAIFASTTTPGIHYSSRHLLHRQASIISTTAPDVHYDDRHLLRQASTTTGIYNNFTIHYLDLHGISSLHHLATGTMHQGHCCDNCDSECVETFNAILAYGKAKTLLSLDCSQLRVLPKEFIISFADHEIKLVYPFLDEHLQAEEDIVSYLTYDDCSYGMPAFVNDGNLQHMRRDCMSRRLEQLFEARIIPDYLMDDSGFDECMTTEGRGGCRAGLCLLCGTWGGQGQFSEPFSRPKLHLVLSSIPPVQNSFAASTLLYSPSSALET